MEGFARNHLVQKVFLNMVTRKNISEMDKKIKATNEKKGEDFDNRR